MSPLGYASSSARARERAAPGRRGSLSGLRLLERRILLRPGRSLVPCGLDRLHHLGAARHRRRWSVTWHRSFLSFDPPAEGSAGPDLARRAGSLRKAPIMMRRALAKTDLDQSGCEIFREALSQSRRQSGALRRPRRSCSEPGPSRPYGPACQIKLGRRRLRREADYQPVGTPAPAAAGHRWC